MRIDGIRLSRAEVDAEVIRVLTCKNVRNLCETIGFTRKNIIRTYFLLNTM